MNIWRMWRYIMYTQETLFLMCTSNSVDEWQFKRSFKTKIFSQKLSNNHHHWWRNISDKYSKTTTLEVIVKRHYFWSCKCVLSSCFIAFVGLVSQDLEIDFLFDTQPQAPVTSMIKWYVSINILLSCGPALQNFQ